METGQVQHDEWMVCRRYMSLGSPAKARMKKIDGNAVEAEEKEVKELVPAAVQAVIIRGMVRWC